MEWYVRSGQTSYSPFYPARVSDPNPLTDTETVNVTLSETGDASLTKGNPGSISDYLNPNLTSSAFSESGLIAGTPPFAQNLLDRLYYNAPYSEQRTKRSGLGQHIRDRYGVPWRTAAFACVLFSFVSHHRRRHTTTDHRHGSQSASGGRRNAQSIFYGRRHR